jgi:hypothetical protein
MRAPSFVIAFVLSCGLLAQPVWAQGKGRGNAFGHAKGSTSAGAAASVSAPAAGGQAPAESVSGGPAPETGVRNFGAWLDDASVLTPGNGFTSFSVGYWRLASFTEIDAPSFDVAFGLTRRVQAGASVPVYHASAPGVPAARGIGDLYLSSKIQLREPAAGTFGFAVIPLVQVLSAEPIPGTGRVSWAVPLSLEYQGTGWRTYGSTGYFSRGSLFASGAIEVAVANRTWVTGTLSQSHSIKHDATADALGLAANRTDISGGATWAASEAVALFGAIGRTLGRDDGSATKLFLSGGLSVTWARSVSE